MIRSTKFCSSVPGQHVTKMILSPAFRARSGRRARTRHPLADTPRQRRGWWTKAAIARPFLVVVLDALARLEHRFLATRHDGVHARRQRTERRREFGGLEHTQPALVPARRTPGDRFAGTIR